MTRFTALKKNIMVVSNRFCKRQQLSNLLASEKYSEHCNKENTMLLPVDYNFKTYLYCTNFKFMKI